ncbi:helix-turn-helix domain-containing protein, partial [Ralstonia pseudosolanacearum]|uniref:helix-turn-helix domain-containing protein n=1 Tax=Ralstonia pseudosolanacearum TaxID=1310165 RepID=UPI00399D731F
LRSGGRTNSWRKSALVRINWAACQVESRPASQAVMARRLRVNVRTYQNWEQGTAKPNTQAAVLIKLVEKHPEMLQMLEAL